MKIININKRGDISTFVLVIGVFFVCATALFAFAFFNSFSSQKFNVLENMASLHSISEQIRFYENAGIEIPEYFNIKKAGNNYNITSIKMKNDERIFYVEYMLPIKSSSASPWN